MSHQTVCHEINVNKDQLLNLFLGQGDVIIHLDEQNVTLIEIHNRHTKSTARDEVLHAIKLSGTSDNPDVIYVDGEGTITQTDDNEVYVLSLELHLQDKFE